MSFTHDRDSQVPAPDGTSIRPGFIGIADARLIAWAFAIGAHSKPVDPSCRRATRRGDLPDVDFSIAVAVPRRSIWNRIAGLFRARAAGVSAGERRSVQALAPIGEGTAADKVSAFRGAG